MAKPSALYVGLLSSYDQFKSTKPQSTQHCFWLVKYVQSKQSFNLKSKIPRTLKFRLKMNSALSLKGFDFKAASPLEYDLSQRSKLQGLAVSCALDLTHNQNFKRWHAESIFKGENGNPQVLWHWTDRSFERFRTNHGEASYYAFGVHLGTFESATARSHNRESIESALTKKQQVDRMVPLVVRAQNALRMSEPRTGRWGVDDIMLQLFEMAELGQLELSDSVIEDFAEDKLIICGEDWFDANLSAQADMLKHFLSDTLKVDCIVYENEFEKGGESILVWDSLQIKSCLANKGTFSGSTSNIYE